MKKLCFSLLLLYATLAVDAQVFRIDEFKLSALENTFGIYADYDCNGSNEFYFDMQASIETQNVQMRLNSNSINDFISSLRDANKVFVSWSETTQENNISSVSKDIYAPFFNEDMYFSVGGIWYEKRKVRLKCRFLVSEEGSCFMVLQSNHIESETMVDAHSYSEGNSLHNLTGEWSTGNEAFSAICPGAFLVFSSSEEIEMFIGKLYKAAEWKTKNIEQGFLLK